MPAPVRATLEHALRATWTGRSPLACALWPLSRLYGALAALHRTLYRRGWLRAERLPVPVIVVGNVIAGGAGKTPTTLALVAHLAAQGWRPGIVSRGHGRATADVREVLADADPIAVGDEPLLLRQRAGAPVWVGARRADAGRALLAAHPTVDVLVCDDGLQHHALARDVEIVVFDARGAGNGWLLPAGPLREPWPRRFKDAREPWPRPVEAVLVTEAPAPHPSPLPEGAREPGNPPVFTATRRLAEHALGADGTRVPLATLRGTPLTAVAGIARPEAFFAMLQAAGLTLVDTVALPDHYYFDSLPRPIYKRETLICTEKDAAKLRRLHPRALAVQLVLDVPAAFWAWLDERLHAQGYHPRQRPPTPTE